MKLAPMASAGRADLQVEENSSARFNEIQRATKRSARPWGAALKIQAWAAVSSPDFRRMAGEHHRFPQRLTEKNGVRATSPDFQHHHTLTLIAPLCG
ncbi:hypothetical protein J2W49_000395 [Hydrogenophaga palleronii]|uniref:Uncharacterized protein n=1 Tax=Hydrogenophaga palleronii TaxID=65655 RepID=A0ABU1WGS0_9BURK|nr:hypothetical protein [Hydrogenophaga palleronii]MDR7148467.1 hypothetical protein [Hydrogenophaga palleronii]